MKTEIKKTNLLPWIESGEYLTPEWQTKSDEIKKRVTPSDIPDKYLAMPLDRAVI